MTATDIIKQAKEAISYSAWATKWGMREAKNMTIEEIEQTFGIAAADLHSAIRSGKVVAK